MGECLPDWLNKFTIINDRFASELDNEIGRSENIVDRMESVSKFAKKVAEVGRYVTPSATIKLPLWIKDRENDAKDMEEGKDESDEIDDQKEE